MTPALRHAGAAVVVFARAPAPGRAKTRLIPALGAQGAAALAQRMLEHAVAVACDARVGPVEVCATPDSSHPAFAALRTRHAVALADQGNGDLGERMHRALVRALQGTSAALLVGTDLPGLDRDMVRCAARALTTCDAVFIPALDGGYGLVGLRAPAPGLFRDMPWSTAAVMQTTRERAGALGLRIAELPPLADVDEPADLARVPPSWLPRIGNPTQ
jgi:rSAM/selenodomain-associated transferase 1